MSIFRKSLAFALAFVSLILPLITPISAEVNYANIRTDAVSVSAQSAILIDASNDNVLFAKNADLRLPMASTTKIMTALLALECGDIDKSYAIPKQAVGVEGSSVYLVEGEQLTLGDLVYALMLESANDAAEAIAIIVAGSTAAFADIMNRRAAELGLTDTHFTNPHGLDHDEHYTSAYDLARLTSYALKNEQFRKIVSTRKTTIPFQGNEGTRLLVNHNRLLRSYEGAIGVKTGFTKRSGRCLVSAAERDGLTLVAVTINAPDDWRDHTSMLDWGFDNYVHHTFAEAGEYKLTIPVCGGTAEWTVCANATEIAATLPRGHGEISVTVKAPRFVFAPISCGDHVGRLIYRCDGEVIGESELYAAVEVKAKNTKKSFWEWLRALFRF
ncbi:MAG: D-alanyl-D-alanine carboxypeptidase [Clostridia bacterium]|nr:D-alanyl-D-alanine carboxypeptidase [Clostridia bacterium]